MLIVLDKNTINKIAAGEVIENPSNVVKELVENSIDAKAKNITIYIEEGGNKLIKVVDDGIGFFKDDMKLCFMNHATSKLTSIDDLYSIDSYGFRGEALPSIAAVSDVTLISKKKNEKSYSYNIKFGEEVSFDEAPSNDGTTVVVRDLFNNTPVRKKFLKSVQKETANIVECIEKMSYVNADISFTLIIDGRIRFKTSGDNNLKNIIYEIYGKDIYDNLIEVDDCVKDIKIYGFIGKPIIARNNKEDIIYFVNKRYVKSKIINKAIEDAYSTYQMQHKYPFAVLYLDIDKKTIDINVHPKKEEVRFENEDVVYYGIYNAIYNALNKISLIHEEKLDSKIETKEIYTGSTIDIKDFNNSEKSIDNLESLSSSINLTQIFNKFSKNIVVTPTEKPFIEKTLTEDHKYIGQVFDTYILVEFDGKLYIIDQHAAHEKINYEKLMKSFKEGKKLSEKIFPSLIVKLTAKQMSCIDENIDAFINIGFEIEKFGDNDIKVDAVPYNLLGLSNKEVLIDMIDSFMKPDNKESYDSIMDKIASISCKKAIKANQRLSESEIKNLLRELFKLDNPYNCPHGRPTIISLSKYEFEKRFGRIV